VTGVAGLFGARSRLEEQRMRLHAERVARVAAFGAIASKNSGYGCK
jgi:hypothetical protein